MPINTWSDAVLCTDADIIAEEKRTLSWNNNESMKPWIDQSKSQIGDRLRHMLRQRAVDMDIDIETDDILNHIYSYEPLRLLAVYYSLFLFCKSATVNPGDLYDQKSRDYLALFNDQWTRSVEMLHLDVDESGTIDDSEQFNVIRDVSIRRGS